MKRMILLFANLLPPVIGGLAAAWTDLSTWVDMKEGLIAFLGFLAASLVQIMPITANFLQSDNLGLYDARRLTASLKKQQYYWIGLLAATIWTLIVLIVSTVLVKKIQSVIIPLWMEYSVSLSAIINFILVSSLFFVLIKMLGLFRGVLSLHDLRTEIIIKNAQDREIQQKKLIGDVPSPVSLPDGYGEFVEPPEAS